MSRTEEEEASSLVFVLKVIALPIPQKALKWTFVVKVQIGDLEGNRTSSEIYEVKKKMVNLAVSGHHTHFHSCHNKM